ncbi:MAG: acyl-CoA dehydrogenase family protein [Minwuia sp.]|nr:acyl-CoA dehydrogenase family protein [Minwuia sp.]
MSRADTLHTFAVENIRPAADTLIRQDGFPHDIWQALGDAGHLGYGLPDWGGTAVDRGTLFDLGQALADGAEVIGFATSWMTHHMVATGVIAPFATGDQAAKILPRVARGDLSCCIAISEPGAGAHPKHLKTRAEKTSSGWRLTGEKAWLTNGPIAGLFVVVAIVSEDAGRKRFGAFLVPEDAPGLVRTDTIHIDFAKPSGHCGIRMDGVELPDDAYLAGAGDAVETVLKRFRRIEDAQGLALSAGGMGVEIRHLSTILPADQALALAGLAADRELFRSAARTLVIDSDGDPASPEHEARLLALRAFARGFQARVRELLTSAMQDDGFLKLLSRDMTELGRVAERVDQAKLARSGAALLQGSRA